MVAPERPPADSYDGNYLVKPHFSLTPGLTLVPSSHTYGHTITKVAFEVSRLYFQFGLTPCPHSGLFFAGSRRATALPGREKYMVLVFELVESDMPRWREIDGDARRILREIALSGLHGVCVRYYQYWAPNTDSDDEQPETMTPTATSLALAAWPDPLAVHIGPPASVGFGGMQQFGHAQPQSVGPYSPQLGSSMWNMSPPRATMVDRRQLHGILQHQPIEPDGLQTRRSTPLHGSPQSARMSSALDPSDGLQSGTGVGTDVAGELERWW